MQRHAGVGRTLQDGVPDAAGSELRVVEDGLVDDVGHAEVRPRGHGAAIERVEEQQQDEDAAEELHPGASPGVYTQILAAAGNPSVMLCPSPDAVIVPAHGATSTICSRRPGRTSLRQRYSSRFLSASASSVIRSTTTLAPARAWASGNGSTGAAGGMPGIGLPCG